MLLFKVSRVNGGASAEIVRPCRKQAFTAVVESSFATSQSWLRSSYDRSLKAAMTHGPRADGGEATSVSSEISEGIWRAAPCGGVRIKAGSTRNLKCPQLSGNALQSESRRPRIGPIG